MMSSFNNQNLFSSGPHAFHVHGLSQRHASDESPGSDGVGLTALGRTGRTIEQSGTLTADTVADLQKQLDAIEAAMDGRAATLVDHLDRPWENVVMIEFHPGPVRRVGLKLVVEYTIRYVQVQTYPSFSFS